MPKTAEDMVLAAVRRARGVDRPPVFRPLEKLVREVVALAPEATDADIVEAVKSLWPKMFAPTTPPTPAAASPGLVASRKARDAARRAERERMKSRRKRG